MKQFIETYKRYKMLKHLYKTNFNGINGITDAIYNKLSVEQLEEVIVFIKKYVGIRQYDFLKYLDDNTDNKIRIANNDIF